jgi:GDSL-like Lipase/Acylhydrolase family
VSAPGGRPSGRRALQRAAALTLGTCAGLLAGEAIVRVHEALGPSRVRAGYDARISEHDPLLGWHLIPGVRTRHHSAEFDVEVAINARGFRQDPPVPDTRTPGVARLAVLGDSFTFGQGVEERERFTERLAADFGAEVVNLGVPGYGTDQALLQFTHMDGAERSADLVVLAWFVDNAARNGDLQRDGRPKPAFELRDGALALRNVPVPEQTSGGVADSAAEQRSLQGLRTFLWSHSRLYVLARRQFGARLMRGDGDARPAWVSACREDSAAWLVTRALFAELAAAAQSQGARSMVLLIPDARGLLPGAPDDCQQAARQACAEAGLPVLDLTPAFRDALRSGARPYFARDGHWTPAGHALAAEQLGAFIREQRLVSS